MRTRVHGAVQQTTWRAQRTPDGPSTMYLQADGARITAQAWGEGARWCLDRVPELLGAHDRPETFVAHHDVVRALHRDHRGLRIGRTGLVWEALWPTIIGQRVTTIEAARSARSLKRTFGELAPGPQPLRLGPRPEAIAALSYDALHEHGIEQSRATTLIRCARVADRLERIVDGTIEAAYTTLTSVAGVGIWTASLVIGQALGDPDAIPIGDYHVPNTVTWALAREPRGTDERMVELLEPYRGHRARVVRLLHLGKIRAPKYGPRSQPRDIRGW